MVSEWNEVQLQEIVSKLGDGLHGTPIYSEDGTYYFINGNNLDNGNIVLKKDTKRVSGTEYEKYKKNLNDSTCGFNF
jgi:type I restriction enzyme, S subunit